MKNRIKQIVEERQGLKTTELVALLVTKEDKSPNLSDTIQAAIQELVHNGEIVELEYVLPNLSYKVKSILFPKGTIIHSNRPVGFKRGASRVVNIPSEPHDPSDLPEFGVGSELHNIPLNVTFTAAGRPFREALPDGTKCPLLLKAIDVDPTEAHPI
jgi:hypothetical protein